MRKEHAGHGPGNPFCILCPHSAFHRNIEAAGCLPCLDGNGDTGHDGIWDPVFYRLLRVDQTEKDGLGRISGAGTEGLTMPEHAIKTQFFAAFRGKNPYKIMKNML
jgi:hypothetical protein